MKNYGGTAFPWKGLAGRPDTYSTGMSLRDYFAAAALQGMVQRGEDDGPYAAESAYRFADAMLKAREAD